MFICLPQGIQDVGDFGYSVECKQRFWTQTVAVCQSYNGSQWDPQHWERKKHAQTKPNEVICCVYMSPIVCVCHRWLPRMRLLCQSMSMRHAPAVVNALMTVGYCGGSEVKNYRNTVQFLAQTNCLMFLDLNVLSRAAGFSLVLSVYVFFLLSKPWVPLTQLYDWQTTTVWI